MFDETTETVEETEHKCVPTLKQIATCMILGASTVVFAEKALLYRRLRKERLAANAQHQTQEPVVQAA